jgi:hypothetical protein
MAELNIDNNYKGVSGGITDEATPVIQPFRVNASTYRLLTEPAIDSEAGGSIAVNVVAGTLTTTVGSVLISDGTITSGTVRIASGTVNIGNNLTIAGGTINTSITSVTITGGTIDVLSAGTVNTTVTVGSLIMSDGTLTSGTVNIGTGTVNVGTVGTVTSITGGTINAQGTINVGTVGTVTTVSSITGGTVNAQGTINVGTVGTVTSITGGTINAQGTINVNTVSTVSTVSAVTSVTGGTINAQGTVNVGTLGTISTGTVNVNTVTNVMSIASGTLLTSGTCNVQTITGGTIWAVGGVAHDAADSQNPLKIGAKATTALSGITAVANNDRTDLYAGIDGVLITRLNSGLEDVVSGTGTINATGLGTVQVIAAGGAGVKIYLTDVTIGNSSGTYLFVSMTDGATKKWHFPVPSLGGVTAHFKTPLAGTANTYWAAEATGSATAVSISASGFKSKV